MPRNTTRSTAKTTATATTPTSRGTTPSKGRRATRRCARRGGRTCGRCLRRCMLSRGAPMLTAGDEFGRTQGGNNNAYAQDNATTWLNWIAADHELADFTAQLAALRRQHAALRTPDFLTGTAGKDGLSDVTWLSPTGDAMRPENWDTARALGVVSQRGRRPRGLLDQRGRGRGDRAPAGGAAGLSLETGARLARARRRWRRRPAPSATVGDDMGRGAGVAVATCHDSSDRRRLRAAPR